MKIHTVVILCVSLGLGAGSPMVKAQAASSTVLPAKAAQESVPRLVQFNGTLNDATARPVSGVASVTFAIYAEQDGGAALWSETQNVLADTNGRYSVLLGSATANGVPAELFGTGQWRWLGVTIARQAEMPRILLASVPYALKAADADTLGGLPASAYVTTQSLAAASAKTGAVSGGNTTIVATPQAASAGAVAPSGIPQVTPTGSGTTDFIPIWTSSSVLGNSTIFESAGLVGIGTTTPAETLDVNGNSIFRGSFQLPPGHPATASSGYESHSFQFEASSYNSSTKVSDTEAFGFRAEPLGNNTSSPSAKLDLFYGPGGGTLTDTGFSLADNGIVTFAAGQTFPGVAEVGAANNFTTSQAFDDGLTAINPTLGVGGVASSLSGTAVGVEGQSNSTAGIGVEGLSSFVGVFGDSSGRSSTSVGKGKAGVWGDTGGGTGDGYVGVLGTADGNSAGGFFNNGIYAALVARNAGSGAGIEGKGSTYGAYGISASASVEGGDRANAGVWGDSATNAGILGTSDSGEAGAFYNNGATFTMWVENDSTASPSPILATQGSGGGSCTINGNGDLYCSGAIGVTEAVESGARSVAVYSVQSPENWSEDFGSGALTNGSANVALEPMFAQTVSAGMGYHVFVTANGDCKGLYVTNKTASGFEVHELGGGVSSVAFDYRIVAKRFGLENLRLEDVTEQVKKVKEQHDKTHRAAKVQGGGVSAASAVK